RPPAALLFQASPAGFPAAGDHHQNQARLRPSLRALAAHARAAAPARVRKPLRSEKTGHRPRRVHRSAQRRACEQPCRLLWNHGLDPDDAGAMAQAASGIAVSAIDTGDNLKSRDCKRLRTLIAWPIALVAMLHGSSAVAQRQYDPKQLAMLPP